MALLTKYPTENLTRRETRWAVKDDGLVRQYRIVKVETTRIIFSTLDEASAYLAASIGESGGEETDGVSRRINEVGWAECFIIKTTEGDWRNY